MAQSEEVTFTFNSASVCSYWESTCWKEIYQEKRSYFELPEDP